MTTRTKTRVIAAALAAVCLGTLSAVSLAKDLGVQGKVWDITEIDMRELMARELAQVDWNQTNQNMKQAAHAYTDNLPRQSLPTAQKTQTKFLDMSIELSSDIRIPVKGADGKYTWQMYMKKGTRINPLDKVRPSSAILYFDGRDPDQLALAKQLYLNPEYRTVAIEVSGQNFGDIAKQFSKPLFFAYPQQLQRFSISELPALIYPGAGAYSQYMANTTFAAPYKVEAIQAVWPNNSSAGNKK